MMLVRRTRLLRRRADERTDAAPGFENALSLVIVVDPRDGVGVDLKVDCQLADRGQLIADFEATRGDRGAQRTFDLGVDRRGIPRVDVNDRHYTVILVH